MAADWLTALADRSQPAVAEARRRWLSQRRFRPTIAEFLEWVASAESEMSRSWHPEGGRILTPIPTEADGTKTSPSRMSEADRWSWHARIRAFRKRLGFSGPSPVDPEGRFLDPELDRQAEAELASLGARAA